MSQDDPLACAACLVFSHLPLALSADTRLLTGQFDGSLRVWDVSTGRIIETLREHTGWITAIVVARDGMTFVTASTDRSIVIWDAETIQPLTRLRGHLAEIWALALSADGRLIASGSQAGLAKLWDSATRRGPTDLTGAHKTLGFIDGGRHALVLDALYGRTGILGQR